MRSIFGSPDFQLDTEDLVGSGLVHDCPFMFMVNALGEKDTAAALVQGIIVQELNPLIIALKKAENLTKMSTELNRYCAGILDTLREELKKNPELGSKKPVNFSVVILLPSFDKKKMLIGFGLGKSMIVLEHDKSFYTLKSAVLLKDGQVRSLPCSSEDQAIDVEMELCDSSVIIDLNPQDNVHLISPDCYQFLKIEEKRSEKNERLISLMCEQDLSDFLKRRILAFGEFKFSNKIFQEESSINTVSTVESLKKEIAMAINELELLKTELKENPVYRRNSFQSDISVLVTGKRGYDKAVMKDLIGRHNEIKVSYEHEKRFFELPTVQKEFEIKLAHLYDQLEKASSRLRLENLAAGYGHACMHLPKDDFVLFELRLCSRRQEISDAFEEEHQKFKSEVSALPFLIVELRQRQLRHYWQLFNIAFQNSVLGCYLVLLALSPKNNVNENLELSYLIQDLDNFPDVKLRAIEEFILFLKDVSMTEAINIEEIVEKLADLTQSLNDPNFVQVKSLFPISLV